jgi:hypothetical protein
MRLSCRQSSSNEAPWRVVRLVVVFILIITILSSVARITVEIPQSSSKLLIVMSYTLIDSPRRRDSNDGVVQNFGRFFTATTIFSPVKWSIFHL